MSSDKEIPAITDSDCLAAMDHLYAYLNDEMGDLPLERAMVEHHLDHCRSCFSRAEMERLLNERLRQSEDETTPETLKKRLRALMDNF